MFGGAKPPLPACVRTAGRRRHPLARHLYPRPVFSHDDSIKQTTGRENSKKKNTENNKSGGEKSDGAKPESSGGIADGTDGALKEQKERQR